MAETKEVEKKDNNGNGNGNPKLSVWLPIVVTLLSIAFMLGFNSSSFETKAHAETTFVNKETFKEHKDYQAEQFKEIKESLLRIETELRKRR